MLIQYELNLIGGLHYHKKQINLWNHILMQVTKLCYKVPKHQSHFNEGMEPKH
jgi:hypothetical protein